MQSARSCNACGTLNSRQWHGWDYLNILHDRPASRSTTSLHLSSGGGSETPPPPPRACACRCAPPAPRRTVPHRCTPPPPRATPPSAAPRAAGHLELHRASAARTHAPCKNGPVSSGKQEFNSRPTWQVTSRCNARRGG